MAEATTQAQDKIQGEALKHAGVGEADPAKRSEVIANRTAADLLRNAVSELGTRGALEFARSRRGVTTEQRDNVTAQFDAATGTQVGNRIDAVNKYLEKSYEGLTPAEQKNRRGDVQKALLASPVMGEYMRGLDLTDPAQQAEADTMAAGILEDKHFQSIVNKRLQKISSREFKPKDKEIQARQRRMQAQAAAGVRITPDQAKDGLQKDFQSTLQRDMQNIMGDSAHELVRTNIDAAEEIVINKGEELDAKVHEAMKDEISARLELRWSNKNPDAYKKKGSIRQDWDQFSAGGLDAMTTLTAEEKQYLNNNPDVKKQFEAQIGESLLLKRMRVGVLKKDDLGRLVDAKWLGDTQGNRIDKIRDIFEQHEGFKNLLADAQANGYIDKDVWDKIKAAGPAAAAGGMLAILLMLLGLPGAAVVGAATKVGIGAAVGGGALYSVNKFRAAA